MLQRVFPRLEGVFGNMVYGPDSLTEWRRDLRVCSPDHFVVYFQFGVAADTLSNQDIRAFTSLGDDEQAIAAALVSAAHVVRPGGHTKAHEFVRRLRDTQGLTPAFARAFVRVALRVGDQFLTPADAVGAFHVSTGVEVSWLLRYLLEVIPPEEREALVIESVEQGEALCTLVIRTKSGATLPCWHDTHEARTWCA